MSLIVNENLVHAHELRNQHHNRASTPRSIFLSSQSSNQTLYHSSNFKEKMDSSLSYCKQSAGPRLCEGTVDSGRKCLDNLTQSNTQANLISGKDWVSEPVVNRRRALAPLNVPNGADGSKPSNLSEHPQSSSSKTIPVRKVKRGRVRSGSETKARSLRPVNETTVARDELNDGNTEFSTNGIYSSPSLAKKTDSDVTELSTQNLEHFEQLSKIQTGLERLGDHSAIDSQRAGISERNDGSNSSISLKDESEEEADEDNTSVNASWGSHPTPNWVNSTPHQFLPKNSESSPSKSSCPQAYCYSFFEPGITLPSPTNSADTPIDEKNQSLKAVEKPKSFITRNALARLKTMILKQRRVDFEHEGLDLNKNEAESTSVEGCHGANENFDHLQNQFRAASKLQKSKVRCTLSNEERILGIRWIHRVDTLYTTNPNISPEVRYHASMLFSLYWGSRSHKLPSVCFQNDKSVPLDAETEKEVRKRTKLIAATAMASLTLATKWYFDFCRPLFTVQLQSFCKTTNFQNFKITPEDLIVVERAILFSYPVAGGLWLDCPHAFVDELIRVIPSLNYLSLVPNYSVKESSPTRSESDRVEHRNNKLINEEKGVQDWSEVMREFCEALEKATTAQEFLAFDPAVLCVVALYVAMEAIEPGYYERTTKSSKKDDLTSPKSLSSSFSSYSSSSLKSLIDSSSSSSSSSSSFDLDDNFSQLWIWKFVDVNETMDQICEVLQVSSASVEACLNWFCQLD